MAEACLRQAVWLTVMSPEEEEIKMLPSVETVENSVNVVFHCLFVFNIAILVCKGTAIIRITIIIAGNRYEHGFFW